MKNKYNIGDKVWVMEGNRPEEKVVTGVFYGRKSHDEDVVYQDRFCYLFVSSLTLISEEESFYEYKVFPTKEELLASL